MLRLGKQKSMEGGGGGERVVVRGQTTRAGRKMTFEKNLSQEAM